ncbi:hypothetical protein [Actinomycetospora lemnae]|uniref:PD-(D/E)XK nuclease superfamily protein n=1 Tax=Actinomycetospora lemnae TaxID=3019891 RepID=A0ABT5T3K6_9PSEU|nr:hypothetical protein [Actinomycetospora sp. DW7H6]MDD7968523.1 hypothetical protein [Actinomycetospora sp. DW7H6]
MNLRDVADIGPYWTISREERNVVALLYAALLLGDNVHRFLDLVAPDLPVERDQVAVYVEYAFLRDLWNVIPPADTRRRDFIISKLDTADVRALADAEPQAWNAHFGGTSTKYWQSPSRWSVRSFHPHITDDDEFLATCRFSWSFNIKPDLVVHSTADHAVVIEAKVESGEGSYPATAPEKAIFDERGLRRVGQVELQQHLMRELLGIEARHLFLTPDGRQGLRWSAAFGCLDLSAMPPWAQRWIARYCA